MPPFYVNKMQDQNFQVRQFESIDAYLAATHKQNNAAKIWYFTRLQLERWSEEMLHSLDDFREACCLDKLRHVDSGLMPASTKLFHPLPRDSRHPEIPFELDDTRLNGWDAQSRNGYFVRTVLLSMLGGKIGGEFGEGLTGAAVGIEEEGGRAAAAARRHSQGTLAEALAQSDGLVCGNKNCVSHPEWGQREVKPYIHEGVCQYCSKEVVE